MLKQILEDMSDIRQVCRRCRWHILLVDGYEADRLMPEKITLFDEVQWRTV